MSEPALISPLLDGYIMGGPISDSCGVCCCPAMKTDTDERYIVKVISVPASPAKIDALLLTGAYPDEASVLRYFEQIADGVIDEIRVLESLSELEGFLPIAAHQTVEMESGKGLDIYMLTPYRRTLERHFKRHIFTHLDVLNLGLDLCAALAVARRSGYLCVDVKPSNIHVTEQQQYRIGDIGFVKLDSLKYASLPERYISAYTAPEITDAFSSLNTTMDIYAAGLVLYQAYNNGQLPFNDDVHPGDLLPAPEYADYEMSEIILKACHPDPQQRWQDPMEMGQAIVSYMQRNGAKDTPVVPPQQEIEDIAENATEEPCEEISVEEEAAAIDEKSSEDSVAEELELLAYVSDEDEEILDEIEDLETISEDVSEILTQADELAAAEVPEPVVIPEYVEVPMPEPMVEVEEEVDNVEDSADTDEEETDTPENEEQVEVDEENPDLDAPKPKTKRRWVWFVIAAVLLAALATGAFFFYKQYYLLPVESISVSGSEDTLTVYVDTKIDESLLVVICFDTYGNQVQAPVINGRALFSDLVPNTAYNIKVVASGFHKLTGDITTAYSTPVQTNIVQFDAVTGNIDGSVILSFSLEGPDSDEWTVYYSARGEAERSATFTSHMVTLTGLTVDSEYLFRLEPKQTLYITGQDKIAFTPRSIVKAENLEIISCMNNALTVQWDVPVGQEVSSWAVYCYNDSYKQTIITTDTFATFQDLDHTMEYTVEVKAAGMSVSEKASVHANSVTAANFKTDTANPAVMTLTWESSQPIPTGGWILRYSIVGNSNVTTVSCSSNSATISPVVPNATYHIQLEDASGNVLLGSKTVLTIGAPTDFSQEFSGFTAAKSDLSFKMCRRPVWKDWDRYDLRDSDYTTEFSAGEKASFLVYFNKRYAATYDPVVTTYVIRNEAGEPFIISQTESVWRDMWYKNYCELDIPVMPTQSGNYTIEVYFNGGLAAQQAFKIK